jgi:hypothetical protein
VPHVRSTAGANAKLTARVTNASLSLLRFIAVALVDDIRQRDTLASPATPPPARTLLDILTDTTDRHGSRVAIDAPDAVLTYTELLTAGRSIADRLHEHGH